MKVLHIIHRYPPAVGGSEQWCAKICKYLSERRVNSRVSTINLYNIEDFLIQPASEKKYRKLGRYDYDHGASIERYPLWTLYSGGIFAGLARALLNLGLKNTELGSIFKYSPHSLQMYYSLYNQAKKVDIVHLYTLPYFHNILGYYIARLLKKKIVITPFFHAGHKDYEKKIFFRIIRGSDAVITLTKHESNYLITKGVDPDKICVTGCFLDQEEAGEDDFQSFKAEIYAKYGISDDSKKIIFIGIRYFYKGIDTLIEAAREIAQEHSGEICLFLVGADTQEFKDRYNELMNRPGRLRVFDFASATEKQKNNLIRLCDILALPSEYESFGIVFLEAWKYSLPVIGSTTEPIPEVIEGAGLCAIYGDTGDLKDKINRLLSDKALARKLGDSGRQKLTTKYSRRYIGNKVLQVYHNLDNSRKRVLIASQNFPPDIIGGSEVVAYKQARVLKAMGFDVRVFAGRIDDRRARYSAGKKIPEFNSAYINLHNADFSHYDFNQLRKTPLENVFRNSLRQLNPDIVHFHNIFGLSPKLIEICHEENIPAVVTVHDYWGICYKNILLDPENHLCAGKDQSCRPCQVADKGSGITVEERNHLIMDSFQKADLLISPSAYLAERFIERGIPREKVRVINNGIDLKGFNTSKTKSKKIRFAYIGQIIEHKGIENLLKAVSSLDDKQREHISLSIIGTGIPAYVDFVKQLAGELISTDTVTFCGSVQNDLIPRLLKKIDAVIIPSIWPENSPVTIMEALASGTPVLASRIGGIPELVQDELNGLLHKHDHPESLAANIRKIISRPAMLREMKQACQEKAAESNLSGQVAKIAGEYKRIIQYRYEWR